MNNKLQSLIKFCCFCRGFLHLFALKKPPNYNIMPPKGRTWRERRNKSENTASLGHKPEYIALFQWAKQNGVFFHKMKPAVFPGTGRGLMATRRIEVGNLLISVPKRLLVSEEIPRYIFHI